MARQLGQKGQFMFKRLGRNETSLALGPLFHPHRGPLQGLAIEIFQALEGSARNEVGFDREKAAFFTRFAIGMLGSMAQETKAVTFGEALHLRNDDRTAAQATP